MEAALVRQGFALAEIRAMSVDEVIAKLRREIDDKVRD